MTSDVSEFFFVGSRLNMAYYVLLFQGLEPPKKVLKGEKKETRDFKPMNLVMNWV